MDDGEDESVDSSDPGPANQELRGMCPFFALVASQLHLSGSAQRALAALGSIVSVESVANIMQGPQ